MKVLRTSDERFADLPDFPYEPRYTDLGDIRMAHVEHGTGPVVLMLHGEPTWSFLYRKMIPVFADNGFRAVAPDLVGFGRSDKPAALSDYSYASHVSWTRAWVEAQELTDITLICQDWGSLIGLRLAASPASLSPTGFCPLATARRPWLSRSGERSPATRRSFRSAGSSRRAPPVTCPRR
jgi:haloalkane dehalogenase